MSSLRQRWLFRCSWFSRSASLVPPALVSLRFSCRWSSFRSQPSSFRQGRSSFRQLVPPAPFLDPIASFLVPPWSFLIPAGSFLVPPSSIIVPPGSFFVPAALVITFRSQLVSVPLALLALCSVAVDPRCVSAYSYSSFRRQFIAVSLLRSSGNRSEFVCALFLR